MKATRSRRPRLRRSPNPEDRALSAVLHTPDTSAALGMEPLLDRGRAALRAYIDGLPVEEQPLGGARAVSEAMLVVTHDDFVAYAALCVRHVIRNGAHLNVLCENGALCAVFDKRTSKC